MTLKPLIEVEDLGFAYRHDEGWLKVLHEVSFTIGPGETFGLVGESGSGKSSLAYQLLGYRNPHSRVTGGRVLFRGNDLLTMPRFRLDRLRGDRLSLVPQDPTRALSPGMHVGRQIEEVLLDHHVAPGRKAARQRVEALLEQVGLPSPASAARKYPHQLSGGEQQRVAIAMALACDPDLVVFDEPTTGLDVTTQAQILALLADLRTRRGMSMLYVTHDLGVLAQIADRVGTMYAGHIVEIAPSAELFARPAHPYTRGLIASVPRIDDDSRSSASALCGLLRWDDLPPGCPYQPRCADAESSCATNHQSLAPASPRHFVACQRWRALKARTLPAARTAPDSRATLEAASPVLEIVGVTAGYGRAGPLARSTPNVIHDVGLTIHPGQVFALVGESGSGKSTIARAICGLVEPAKGHILFQGQPLSGGLGGRPAEVRRQIQYIFQNPDASLNPRAQIGRTLARPAEFFFGADRTRVRARVAEALRSVRLDPSYAERFPNQLSGGERQRVAIARALLANPTLLICDEILSALDVSVQSSILTLIRQLRQETGVAMLFISHDLAVVRSLADRVGVLFRGHLMEIGAARQVFAAPFHPYTYTLLAAVPALERKPVAPLVPVAPRSAGDGHGCPFAERCPWHAGRICDEEAPPWRETARGLHLRCHRSLEELSALAAPAPMAVETLADGARAVSRA